jgi:hypothetical protein
MHRLSLASRVADRPASAPGHPPRHARWLGGLLLTLGCLLFLAGDLAPAALPAPRHPAPLALFGETACHLPPGIPLPAGAFFDRAQATTVEAVPHEVY